jgi:hypothetical protein
MKLPGEIRISDRKIRDYLLRRRDECDKSSFLAGAGFSSANWNELLDELLRLAACDAEFIGRTEYGDKYHIRGTLRGPNATDLQ